MPETRGPLDGRKDRCQVKVFVDTAPVPEKALAQAAGLGWQGKHTNAVSRDSGTGSSRRNFTTLTSIQMSLKTTIVGHVGPVWMLALLMPFPRPIDWMLGVVFPI